MANPCPPSAVDITTQSLPLGMQGGFTAHIGGVAVDDRFVYATHGLHDPDILNSPPGVGHLVVIDRAAFGDPNAAPVRVPVGFDPHSVAVNPNNGGVYVVNCGHVDENGSGGYSLSVVRRAPGTSQWAQQAQLALPFGLVDVAVNTGRPTASTCPTGASAGSTSSTGLTTPSSRRSATRSTRRTRSTRWGWL